MKKNRWIAAFLSLILIMCTMVSPVSAKGYSKNANGSGNKSSWSQLKEKSRTEETSEKEAVSDDESAVEDTSPVYLDGSLTGSDGSYNVKVTFGEDAQIPEGSSVSVEALTEGDAGYQEAREQVQPENETSRFAVVDISILDAEGNKIEPKAAVQVQLEVSGLPEGVTSIGWYAFKGCTSLEEKPSAMSAVTWFTLILSSLTIWIGAVSKMKSATLSTRTNPFVPGTRIDPMSVTEFSSSSAI